VVLAILEGVDGTGKSTLADMLHEQFNGDVERRSCGPPKKHVLEEYVADIETYTASLDHHVIYDRHYLGELIYGPLYRGGSQLDDAMKRYVELVLQARGAVVVIIHPGDGWLERTYGERGETFLKREHAELAKTKFARLCLTRGVITPTQQFGFANDSDVRTIKWLAILRAEVSAGMTAKFTTLVGNATGECEYLILGDTRGPLQ